MNVVDRPGVETGARTRVYRISWGQKLFAFMVLGVGCVSLLRSLSGDLPNDDIQRVFYDLVLVGTVVVGAWLVLSSFWSKVTWSPRAIAVRTLTETTELPLDAIRGRREYETRGSKGATIRHFVLVPKDDQMPTLDLTDRFSFDQQFDAWFSGLPDLDTRDGKNSNFGLI
jgi:hypothetical protein